MNIWFWFCLAWLMLLLPLAYYELQGRKRKKRFDDNKAQHNQYNCLVIDTLEDCFKQRAALDIDGDKYIVTFEDGMMLVFSKIEWAGTLYYGHD